MELNELCGILGATADTASSKPAINPIPCVVPDCEGKLTAKFFSKGKASYSCTSGCKTEAIETAIAAIVASKVFASGPGGEELPPPSRPAPPLKTEKRTDSATRISNRNQSRELQPSDVLRRVPPQNIEAEQAVLGAVFLEPEALATAKAILGRDDFYRETHREIFRAMEELVSKGVPVDALTMTESLSRRGMLEQIGGPAYIAELADAVPTAANVAHYARIVREKSVRRKVISDAQEQINLAHNGVSTENLIGEVQSRAMRLDRATTLLPTEITWEGFDAAISANEEYMKRRPVVDRLCYSSAVSMITGGKHAGKSTLARWMAICVAKGWQFLGRDVIQGPVFYIASEDETMAARQELIRLGWKSSDPLRFLSASTMPTEEIDLLAMLTKAIRQYGVVLTIVDMLFDFIHVGDEMKYAETRRAVGEIQNVATHSESHLCVIHHAPKNANIGDAAVAALGSQGLAARVSPILLVRRFGPGVHSVSSTEVRDPRGESIKDSRLTRNSDGSMELGGLFKNYMLAEVYAERVLELLQAEDGSEMTAIEVSDALDISYQVAKGSLAFLTRETKIYRSGEGKKGKPFRYSTTLSKISTANSKKDDAVFGTSLGQVPNPEPSETEQKEAPQGRFGYKED